MTVKIAELIRRHWIQQGWKNEKYQKCLQAGAKTSPAQIQKAAQGTTTKLNVWVIRVKSKHWMHMSEA